MEQSTTTELPTVLRNGGLSALTPQPRRGCKHNGDNLRPKRMEGESVLARASKIAAGKRFSEISKLGARMSARPVPSPPPPRELGVPLPARSCWHARPNRPAASSARAATCFDQVVATYKWQTGLKSEQDLESASPRPPIAATLNWRRAPFAFRIKSTTNIYRNLLISSAGLALLVSLLAAGQLQPPVNAPAALHNTPSPGAPGPAPDSLASSERPGGGDLQTAFASTFTTSARFAPPQAQLQLQAPAPTSSGGSSSPTSPANEDGQLLESQQQPYDYHANMPVITKRELANAIKLATGNIDGKPHYAELTSGRLGKRLLSPLNGADSDTEGDQDGSQDESSNLLLLAEPFPSWLTSAMFHKAAPEDAFVLNQTRQALISEEATRLLAKQFKLNQHQTLRGLPLISVDQTALGRQCPRSAKSFNCLPGRYRSLSGHCNNVQQAEWGAALAPLVRYAPARYNDNVARPVRSAREPLLQKAAGQAAPADESSPLPSARQVSMAVYEAAASGQSPDSRAGGRAHQQQQQHSHMTTLLSFFGQFIFHDLAHVPQFSKSIKCCNKRKQQQQQAQQHPECMPVELKGFCLDYVRSTPAARSGCNLGARDQLNLVSSFLDGSVIYGSSEQQARQLRSFSGGRLRSQRPPQGAQNNNANGPTASLRTSNSSPQLELLPQIKWLMGASNETEPQWWAAAHDCLRVAAMRQKRQTRLPNALSETSRPEESPAALMQEMNQNCFQAGDVRVNENIGLTLMHTIWMREHNLIANQLAQLNRHWRDERLFEEARRIVIAELQQITFNELLPSILGDDVMQRFNLTVQSQGYFQGYDPSANPGVSNELAAAVFPFIQSTIPSALERYSDRLEMIGSTSLTDTFLDGSDLFVRNKFAQYLTGMISQSAMEPALGIMPMTVSRPMSVLPATSGNRARGKRQARTLAEIGSVEIGDEYELLERMPSDQDATTEAPPTGPPLQPPPQMDALALIIQQGRDHGLRPYLYWRRACQLQPAVRNWAELELVMPRTTVDRLRRVYASPEQLDLYLALLETPAPGATVGPTFVCLLARQFYQLKHGDRYWFENDLPNVAFAPKQLEELRQTSLARVLCRNSQSSISFVQPAPLLSSDPFLNAYQYCTNKAMLELDLAKWRQPINSADQILDEQLASELGDHFGHVAALRRAKRLIEESEPEIVGAGFESARAKLEGELVRRPAAGLRRAQSRPSATNGASNQNKHRANHAVTSAAAFASQLPRVRRQALESINNMSTLLELATNEVVQALLRQGKDRERAQSVQSDIRDFLYSLESVQLNNLLDNTASSEDIAQFIKNANGLFLSEEQRQRLALNAELSDPLSEILALASSAAAGRPGQQLQPSSSISTNCQDDSRVFPCDHTNPFRTITGWCNNLQSPKFGQSFTLHDRILPSAYDDGLAKARQLSVVVGASEAGERQRLPSARLVSTAIHNDKSRLHARYSLALMQFGQFGVDHDLTRTPFSVGLNGALLDCSACDSQQTVHRDCMPIEVPENDTFFGAGLGSRARARNAGPTKCLHFVRSLNGQQALGPRQQLNSLTAFLDASEIYGSDNCEARSLRTFQGGRLNSSSYPPQAIKMLDYTPRELLPTTHLNPECVTPPRQGQSNTPGLSPGLCFHAGDQRGSEQPGLTAIHTIFLRLHNSIVDQLHNVNRHWNDERLYQTGRKILGAIMQRITYNEFAPRLLGLDLMSKFDLMLKQVGYVDTDTAHYDETCSAGILAEFAAAAFRVGHSLIRAAFPLLDRQYKQMGKPFQLRTAFFNSQRILNEPQLIDSILRGIVSSPIETLDNAVSEELTNHLFEKPREPHSGMDLIALNIQRARDHGIPAYNRYRQKCNLTRARTFDDLSNEIPQQLIERLSDVYASVEDIDLFTGGLSEMPVHGGSVGPTLGCIIGMQLSRLKRCDRFWHETSNPFVRFSAAQLAEIRKMTLAKVICSQSDSIDFIQKHAMDVPDSYLNPRLPCSSLPAMDLGVWRENQKSCLVNKLKIDLGQSRRISPCKSCTCTLEGPLCRTAKINCLKMLQLKTSNHNALNQVTADKSCLVQCAWALDMQQLH